MRILSARIFSKSFGGKIEHGQTDVDKETTFTKKKIDKNEFKLVFNYCNVFDKTSISTQYLLAIKIVF